MFHSARLAAIFSIMTGLALPACLGASDESVDTDTAFKNTSAVAGGNLCTNQAANTFQCIDDTSFQHCIGNDQFVVNSCPKGLCATRHPANQNPCVGADRAAQLDGVPPTPPGQVDANPAPGGNNGGGNTGGDGGQCVGGPKFDPAGDKNVGNGVGGQFIGGQCLRAADCASGCCALPCGICSGPGAQFQAGKQGCGFGG